MVLCSALAISRNALRLRGAVLLRTSSTIATGESIVLRPYQENCIQACLDALDSGATRIGVSLPTGAGKTTVFLALLDRMTSDRRKAMVIVNSVELAKQASAQAIRLFPQINVEIDQGQKNVASGEADLTIATYQTLMRGTRLLKYKPEAMKAIIIDEAHHAAAPSYKHVLSHFDPYLDMEKRPPSPVPILGFSATFSRHDGLALGSVFDQIVYHRDFLEMIKEQWLCSVRFTTVKVQLDLSQVTLNGRSGDFNPTSLAQVVNTDTINHVVVQSWIDRVATRKSTLIFCVNLAHVRDLTQVFREAGIDARYLHSGTPVKERSDLLKAFKYGEFPVLVNCSILTEGADIPNIDCIMLARPTRSRNLFQQMIGRGMRLSPQTGKQDCHILDFVDSTTRVQGVITTPTLFGLSPEDEVEDESLEDLEKRADAMLTGFTNSPDVDIPDPKSITYKDYDNPFVLVNDTSGCPHINQMSSFAWCGVGDDIFVLECLNKGFIRIQPFVDDNPEDNMTEKPAYLVTYTGINAWVDKESSSPFLRPRRIMTAITLNHAVRGADTYAATKICPGNMSASLFRNARWRKTLASETQKEYIARRWGLRTAEAVLVQSASQKEKEAQLAQLTKGDAANMITRFKHGAASRFSKSQKKATSAAVKAAKNAAKELARKEREVVRVGPLRE